jgi:predicted kinase
MTTPRVFNPDDYLWTPAGRVYTDERSAKAWEQLYSDLEMLFSVAAPEAQFFLVMGVQGAGKSTWIRHHRAEHGSSEVFLDAALPARRHRARAMSLVRRFGIRAPAVWLQVPLEQALRQNAQRPPDQVVPESAVRSVFDLLEAPTVDEGFEAIVVVTGSAHT